MFVAAALFVSACASDSDVEVCASDLSDQDCRDVTAEAMRANGVPTVAVAVIEGGNVVSAAVLDWEGEPAPIETMFQAASLSKPVAAAVALSLLPRAAELEALLSHSAGVSVSGFQGYRRGAALPTTDQILAGAGPANNAPVENIGRSCAYSGGGYTRVQAMVEDASGLAFAEAAEPELRALGMQAATFGEPREPIALAHDEDGEPIVGGWHEYPEKAAAGLWSAVGDYARYVAALPASDQVRPIACGYGLGPKLDGEVITHDGVNEGYRARFVIHRQTANGVVVLTNSDSGFAVIAPIIDAVARDRGWERF